MRVYMSCGCYHHQTIKLVENVGHVKADRLSCISRLIILIKYFLNREIHEIREKILDMLNIKTLYFFIFCGLLN